MRHGLFILLALIASVAQAAGSDQVPLGTFDPTEVRCRLIKAEELVARTIEELDWASTVLPGVPPEEASYLDAESKAAGALYRDGNSGQSEARYEALDRRPLYPIWKLRSELTAAKTKLGQIERAFPSYPKSVEASRAQAALDAQYAVNRFVIELSRLLERESFRASLRLTANQHSRFHSMTLTFTDNLSNYVGCKLAKVMGPQSWR